MISMEQINGEIAMLEDEKPTHVIMQKLASLYIVRDHMTIPETAPKSRYTPVDENDSEFIALCKSKDTGAVLRVLNEHFDAIKLLYPKEYDSIIEKLKAL